MIHAIVGRSASGKSIIEREVSKTLTFLNRIVSDTTRLAREGEEDGVDYHFITRDSFKTQLGDYVGYNCFNGWYYGINTKRIDLSQQNICVVNPSEYYQLKARYGNLVQGYVIHADGKERLLRSLNRETSPDVYECCRRYIADEDDFTDIESDPTLYHISNNGLLADVVEEVTNKILEETQRRAWEYVNLKREA